jgi:DNA-binding FadR family transcriptional regulator
VGSQEQRGDQSLFRAVGQRRAFEEILDQLEEAIASGRLRAGERLPAERDLAAQFVVSRASVREALRVLEALGITRVQRGYEHGAVLLEEPSNALEHLLRFYVALRHVSMTNLVEAIVLVQAWAARRVARDANTEALDALRPLVEEMQDPGIDQVRFRDLDNLFHSTLVESSGNPIATLVLEGCRESLRRLIDTAIQESEDWESVRSTLAEEHREIFAALESGDGERAEALLTQHLEFWTLRAIELAGLN